MKVQLSVVIITLNEEKNIERCLESVLSVADEIVIVDSFSNDQTEEICKKYNVKFIQHAFEGYIEQKNWALSQAKFDHILSLDADEALDDKLQKNILSIKNNWQFDGYYMNRLTNYCGKWVRHCGWYPDRKLRLFNKTKGCWTGINPHDKYELYEGDKTASFVKSNLLHYSYYTVDEHYKQTRKFAKITANSLYSKNKKSNFINRFLSPLFRFFRDYILLRGILDGKTGLTICRITAFGTYLKYKNLHKLWNSAGKTIGINGLKRILISRTDAIGDVILTLPICGIIKKYYPDVEIVFLGKTYTEAIINHCENIDQFVNVDTLFKLSKNEQIEMIKNLNTDTIIHVYPNKKIAKLALLANIKNRIGTSNRTFHWTTLNHFVFFSRKKSNLHESQLNCKLLRPLGIDIEPSLKTMSNFTGLSKNIQISNFEIDTNKINIILHPKSNASAREWSLGNFKLLINSLNKDRYTFYITGTDKEKEILGDWIKGLPDNVIDVTGKFNLDEFISFIANVDFLVAASTGPLHIAAALGTEAIGIYPPMRPIHPGRWQPIGEKAHYLVASKNCNDCIGNPTQCACMNLVKPQQVASLILNK